MTTTTQRQEELHAVVVAFDLLAKRTDPESRQAADALLPVLVRIRRELSMRAATSS
jgi:hypothetical protein